MSLVLLRLFLATLGGSLAVLGADSAPVTAGTPPIPFVSPSFVLASDQPSNAFTVQHPPHIGITIANTSGQAWQRQVRVERFDLLDGKTSVDLLPASIPAAGRTTVDYAPTVPFGVYRLDVSLVQNGAAPSPAQRIFFAYAPAAAARDLPDDWPLAIHVTVTTPPLPGFKWYRFFTHWSRNNPARGVYDWASFDSVFAEVKAAGGKLLIADDTTPIWTVAPERAVGSRVKSHHATAYPPDNMEDLRTYLRALLARYDDGSGTLAALETWNEPNTKGRWMGTPAQLVEIARVFRETAHEARRPPLIVGVCVSAGGHADYINAVMKAGILPYLDVVSGHWYEELTDYQPDTPNSLSRHLAMLTVPMKAAGFSLPVWNTESGLKTAPRQNGRLVPQDELNRQDEAAPGYNAAKPWLSGQGQHWRAMSERRCAGGYVAAEVMLMSLGVEKSFFYTPYGWILDGAPSLDWVAVSVLGRHLQDFDFHRVVPVATKAQEVSGAPALRTYAYRIGAADRPGLIVVWASLPASRIGRSKVWQPWLNPVPIQIASAARQVEVSDLYGRNKTVLPVNGGTVTVQAGEEPVYVREMTKP